jgi:hypothetical protein
MIEEILGANCISRRKLPKRPDLRQCLYDHAQAFISMHPKFINITDEEERNLELARCILAKEVVLVPVKELQKMLKWSQNPVYIPEGPNTGAIRKAVDSTWKAMSGDKTLLSTRLQKISIVSDIEKESEQSTLEEDEPLQEDEPDQSAVPKLKSGKTHRKNTVIR